MICFWDFFFLSMKSTRYLVLTGRWTLIKLAINATSPNFFNTRWYDTIDID